MFSLFRKRTNTSKTARKSTAPLQRGVMSRTVSHQRWIPTDQLERGMYVSELNVPWEDTGFMFQGFEVDSYKVIKDIQAVATHALVKSQKVAQKTTKNARQVCTA